jgi:hypothetical protein
MRLIFVLAMLAGFLFAGAVVAVTVEPQPATVVCATADGC